MNRADSPLQNDSSDELSFESDFDDTSDVQNLADCEETWANWRSGEGSHHCGFNFCTSADTAATSSRCLNIDDSCEPEPCRCLFCCTSHDGADSCLDHMATAHGFDFEEFAKCKLLSVYGALSFVNYVRRASTSGQCALCFAPIEGGGGLHAKCADLLVPLPCLELQVNDVNPGLQQVSSPPDVAKELSQIAEGLGVVRKRKQLFSSGTVLGLQSLAPNGGLAKCGFWSDPVNLVPVLANDPLLSFCTEVNFIFEKQVN